MPSSLLRPAIRTAVFLLLYIVAVYLAIPLLDWAGGYLFGVTVGGLIAACAATGLCMLIFDAGDFLEVGLALNRQSLHNAFVGFAGGFGAAALVMLLPLAAGLAHLAPSQDHGSNWRTLLFVPVLIFCGALGEELVFHGFGFQVLLREFGPLATVLPVGALFGLLHASNPNVSKLGIANTVGFGILFGFAFLRSHDLWLPVGLHFGWNFTLPLFGANLSGITIRPTGLEIIWKAGPLWSGGAYGPEASVLTVAILLLLSLYVWKVPVRRQYAPVYESAQQPY